MIGKRLKYVSSSCFVIAFFLRMAGFEAPLQAAIQRKMEVVFRTPYCSAGLPRQTRSLDRFFQAKADQITGAQKPMMTIYYLLFIICATTP